MAHPCQQHIKFQPSKHKAQLQLLLLLDIGLFLAYTSTIIDRIPPKESLCASLAGGVHLTGGHFRWEKQILRALTNTTLPPPIPDTYSKISGARHENVVIRRKQRHTCDQILETTKIYQDSQLHTATSPWKLRKHHHQKGWGALVNCTSILPLKRALMGHELEITIDNQPYTLALAELREKQQAIPHVLHIVEQVADWQMRKQH